MYFVEDEWNHIIFIGYEKSNKYSEPIVKEFCKLYNCFFEDIYTISEANNENLISITIEQIYQKYKTKGEKLLIFNFALEFINRFMFKTIKSTFGSSFEYRIVSFSNLEEYIINEPSKVGDTQSFNDFEGHFIVSYFKDNFDADFTNKLDDFRTSNQAFTNFRSSESVYTVY